MCTVGLTCCLHDVVKEPNSRQMVAIEVNVKLKGLMISAPGRWPGICRGPLVGRSLSSFVKGVAATRRRIQVILVEHAPLLEIQC